MVRSRLFKDVGNASRQEWEWEVKRQASGHDHVWRGQVCHGRWLAPSRCTAGGDGVQQSNLDRSRPPLACGSDAGCKGAQIHLKSRIVEVNCRDNRTGRIAYIHNDWPQRIWVEFDDGEENEKDVTWFVSPELCWSSPCGARRARRRACGTWTHRGGMEAIAEHAASATPAARLRQMGPMAV